ncbi:MAG: flagellar basal body-associated FliL family protein [Bacillota bacterium]
MKKIIIILLAVLLIGAGVVIFILMQPEKEPEVFKSHYETGDYFITNVKESEKLLKTTIVLEVDKAAEDEEFYAFLEENNHVIRNNIISILREKNEKELRTDDSMRALATEISKSINETLGIDNVKTVFFTEYVLQ